MVVIVDDHDQENDRITNAVQFLLVKISRVKESIDMYMGLRKKIWLEDATIGEIIRHHNFTYRNDPLVDASF